MEKEILSFLDRKKQEQNKRWTINIFNSHLPESDKIQVKDQIYTAFNKANKVTQYYILKDLMNTSHSEIENDVSEHDIYLFSRRFSKYSSFKKDLAKMIDNDVELLNELKSETIHKLLDNKQSNKLTNKNKNNFR